MKWRSVDFRILVFLGVFGFFGIASLYAVEIPYFNRYFSFSKLMIYGLVLGLFTGAGCAWYFGKDLKIAYDRLRLRIGLVFAGLLFGPLVFSLINRHLDPWPGVLERVEFVDLEDRFSSRFGVSKGEDLPEANSFHIYFYRNKELTRIVFNKKLDLSGLEKGDFIGIKVRNGLFGVEWVQSVQKLEGEADFI